MPTGERRLCAGYQEERLDGNLTSEGRRQSPVGEDSVAGWLETLRGCRLQRQQSGADEAAPEISMVSQEFQRGAA
ncbi:MAG TPA: hypothetical protein VN444_02520, partial [Verrucomicrobiae bacterium]|nr:hypothetical protein [Verrucomicrobiae bacterium]